MAEPTTKELLAGIMAAVQAQGERLEAVENAAAAPAPAQSSGGGRRQKQSKPFTNSFTPSAVLRQGWGDVSPGDTLTYVRTGKNPGESTWTVHSVEDDGTVNANRA